jgi:hypothetical protein
LLPKNIKIKRDSSVILPVPLYWREAWSLTLRAESSLRVFGNGVLRGVFRPKRDEVTGECRRIHNEELYDLHSSTKYYSGDKIKKEVGWTCSTYGERRDPYMILVKRLEGRIPLGRYRQMRG